MPALLDDAAIDAALQDLPGWERDGGALVRTAQLPTFPSAIGVVARVGEIAESRNHHPDMDIRWSREQRSPRRSPTRPCAATAKPSGR